jgi:tetratricopeptide (TPR) repeat protein
VLLPSDHPLVLYQRVDLAPAHGYVLSRIDGTLSAREILGIVPLPAEDVERALFALLCTGIVEFAAERARAPGEEPAAGLRQEIVSLYDGLPGRSDLEVLGLEGGAGEAEIKAAYFRLAKRFHPDVHHSPELADLRHKLEAIFFRLHDAYRTLTGPRPAAATAPHPDTEQAVDGMVRKADDRLRDGRHWEAIALLEEAMALSSGRLRTRARLLLSRALLKYPDREKQAEKELQAVVQEDPSQADAHYLLGALYKRRGLANRAAAMLNRALELNPRHRAARAELEDGDTEDGGVPGRLRRLFGKG